MSRIGIIIIIGLIIAAIFAPFIAQHDPSAIDIKNAYLTPSFEHLMGTDSLGRDVFSRIVYGGRVTLSVSIIAVMISFLIGLFLGSVAGYFEGVVSSVIMRFTDIMLCFPRMFLILAVIAMVGPNILNVMIIIGVTSWMATARLIRAEILSLKKRDFVLASKALGRSEFFIITRHLIPNGMGPVIVNFVFSVAAAILIEAGLSFLGLGVQPPTSSWGSILMEGKAALGYGWWIILFPGLAILISVLSFNMLGEGLRKYFNPKVKQ